MNQSLDMIRVDCSRDPFGERWVVAEVLPGQTIAEITGRAPVYALVNGHEVSEWFIERARLKPGVSLRLWPMPQDGQILRAIAGVLVAVVGAVAFNVVGGGILGAFVGAAIAVGGNLLINALIPPASLDAGEGDSATADRLKSLSGASNQVARFTPIPRLYGTMRYFPPMPMTAQPFTESAGSDQFLRIKLLLGWGPLDIGGVQAGGGAPLITQSTSLSGIPIRIGDTDIHVFDEVEFEIGDSGDTNLYTDQVIEEKPNFTTNSGAGLAPDLGPTTIIDGDQAIRATSTDTAEISVDIAARLFSVNQRGFTTEARITWRIEYRLAGSADPWVNAFGDFDMVSQRRETIRISRKFLVTPGQYDVRLTRVQTFHQATAGISNEASWVAIRSFRRRQAFVVPGTVVMDLRIKATDQLNGVVDNLSVLASSILPVWNGSAWVDQVTSNPAWIYADILTGSATRSPIDKSRLDTDALTLWADEADAQGRAYHSVMEGNATTLQRIREVTSTGRAAWSLEPDGRFSVVRDVDESTPRMVISPRNSSSYRYEQGHPDIPEAFRVQFTDPDTWEQTERLVFDDGIDQGSASVFETLKAAGVTDAEQAWKFGRYELANRRLRPTRHSFTQDVQHLRYKRGDLLTLQHDVILVGIAAGRVKAITTDGNGDVTSITSDELLLMAEAFESYGLKVQLSNGSIAVVGIVTDSPSAQTVTLQTATTGIQVGDHFIFGLAGRESIDIKPVRIEMEGDLQARITAVPAAPEVLDAETGPIPPFDPVITLPTDPNRLPIPTGTITAIESDESVLLRDTDGSLRTRMVVETNRPVFPGWDIQTQVRYREQIAEPWILAEPRRQDAISLLDVDEGVVYEVQLRFVRDTKNGQWSSIVSHQVVGKSTPPADVTNFAVTAARDRIALSWDDNTEVDLSHYVIREGSVWETALEVARVDGTRFQTAEVTNGPWLIKAFDTSGNESVNAASAAIVVNLPAVINLSGQVVDNNVLLAWESTPGTFDIASFEIRRGPTLAGAAVIGKADTTFDVVFELVGGEIRYWVVPIDSAGNEGTAAGITLNVDTPPDFVLNNEFQTDWQGEVATNVHPRLSSAFPRRFTTREFSGIRGDGTIGEVVVGDVLDWVSDYTVEFWGFSSSLSSANAFFVSKGDGSAPRWYIAHNLISGISVFNSQFTLQGTMSGFVPQGRWFHVAVVYDDAANTLRIYVNGRLDGERTSGVSDPLSPIAAPLRFGADGAGNHLHGKMAEVRIWNVARTATQILDFKDRTLSGDESGLIGYWRMKEGGGSTVVDRTTNGNDGAVGMGIDFSSPNVPALIPGANRSRDDLDLLGYNSRDDLIAAGYDHMNQPVPASAQFVETYNANSVIASTRIDVTLSEEAVVGTVTSQVTISVRKLFTDPWTDFPAGETSVFASDFQYVKVTVDYTPADDKSFLEAGDIRVRLSSKLRNDAGLVTVSANPTSVSLNVAFNDIISITATPQGTAALQAVVDFVDVLNPTGFDLYLFDSSGNAATGDVRWAARGN